MLHKVLQSPLGPRTDDKANSNRAKPNHIHICIQIQWRSEFMQRNLTRTDKLRQEEGNQRANRQVRPGEIYIIITAAGSLID